MRADYSKNWPLNYEDVSESRIILYSRDHLTLTLYLITENKSQTVQQYIIASDNPLNSNSNKDYNTNISDNILDNTFDNIPKNISRKEKILNNNQNIVFAIYQILKIY